MPETHDSASAFDLPERLRRKADPALIAGDEARFAAIGAALAAEIARTNARLDALRREPASAGQRALERDLEIRAESARLRVLQRFGIDACIGRMVGVDGTVTYIGRFGLAAAGEEHGTAAEGDKTKGGGSDQKSAAVHGRRPFGRMRQTRMAANAASDR